MTHRQHVISGTVIFLAVICGLYIAGVQPDKEKGLMASDEPALDDYTVGPRLRRLVEEKSKALCHSFEHNNAVQELLKEVNAENSELSGQRIQQLDKDWISVERVSEFQRSILVNDMSGNLFDFQREHPSFVEIFLTDSRGLVVAMTNITTDYLQSDEAWWENAVRAQKTIIGDLEYDQSVQSEVIPVYMPIFDKEKKELLGVFKGVLSLTTLQMGL